MELINIDLKGKVALVTGSLSGIGLVIATTLIKAGANVILNDIVDNDKSMPTLEKVRKDAKGSAEATYLRADVTNVNEVYNMIDEVVKKYNRLDILVNNAGIQFVSPIEDFPEEKWQQIIKTNLLSAFYTSKRSLPIMAKNKWGRVINIASAHGLVASAFKSAYVAAKHGLIGLTQTIAIEEAQKGITCNAICPGYVDTPLVRKQIAEQAVAHHISEGKVMDEVFWAAQVNHKFIKAEHIADLVVFVCSDSAEEMTGEIISIDGGWTAH